MATPPRTKGLTRELTQDAPAWWTPVLAVLSAAFSDITAALDKQLTRRENMRGDWSDVEFSTRVVVSETYPILIKNRMASKPDLLWLGNIERDDGGIIADPPTVTFKMTAKGEIGLYFQGLAAATKYRARVVYE